MSYDDDSYDYDSDSYDSDDDDDFDDEFDDDFDDESDDDFESNEIQFRDPGGRSALRAGKRRHPCPTCDRPNQLTDADVRLHYQCDHCADLLESGRGY
jgi:hypothetical protein